MSDKTRNDADQPKTGGKLLYGLYAVCAGLLVAEFFFTKKTYVAFENIPGFYALYGFVICVLAVFCAKGLRKLLKRDEAYYAPYDIESEAYPQDQLDEVDRDV